MIVVGIKEGLGNQMFQYAFALVYKIRGGQNVRIESKYAASEMLAMGHVKRKYELRNFNISLKEIDIDKSPRFQFISRRTILDKIKFQISKTHFLGVKYYDCGEFFFNARNLSFQGDCYITGWFQNEKYFREIRKILLKEFTLVKKISLDLELEHVLENRQVVSVHIRRGDYKKYHITCPLGYYKKAIDYIKERVDKPIVFFFSDDLAWVKNNFADTEAFYINEDRNIKDYEELMIMSRCKHNIIANSTFSWWGAWLNQNEEKIVIAPKVWNKYNKDFEIIPDDWVQI